MPHGNQLGQHIHHPKTPQQMHHGEFVKERKTLQHIMLLKSSEVEYKGNHQDHAPGNQPYNIALANIGNRNFQHRQISLYDD